jgi:hypothetical protein
VCFINADLTMSGKTSLSALVYSLAIGGDEHSDEEHHRWPMTDTSRSPTRSRAITPCPAITASTGPRRARTISFHEARTRYLLSRSEFEQWEADYLASGGDAERMQDA